MTLCAGAAPNLPVSNQSAQIQSVWAQSLALPLVELWIYNLGNFAPALTSSVVPANGLLLFGTGNGQLVALDRATRQVRWSFSSGGAIYGAPVVANGIVYFGSADKKIYALNLVTGGMLWAFKAQDVISGSAALTDTSVYFGSEDRSIYALNARTGALRWTYGTGGPVTSTPIVQNGLVYVGSDDAVLYALDAATGEPRWAYKTGKGHHRTSLGRGRCCLYRVLRRERIRPCGRNRRQKRRQTLAV